MARFRKLARRYARHTGELYGVGYQYRDPVRNNIHLGPFKGMVGGTIARQAIPNYLHDTINVQFNDGLAKFLFNPKTEDSDTNKTVCGMFYFHLVAGDLYLEFYRDRADGDELKFDVETPGTSLTGLTTGETSAADLVNEENVTAVEWQNDVYFSTAGFTEIQAYDHSGGSATAVSGSPSGVFLLLVIEGNMVGVRQNGAVYEVVWAVDGDPTDWSGAGSGAQPIPNHLGKPHAFVQYGTDGIILCQYGAYQVAPTRTLPPFGFATRDDISGCPWMHGAVSRGHQIVYMGPDGYLRLYDGREQLVGRMTDQMPIRNIFPGAFYWSHIHGKVFIPSPANLLFDPDLREYATAWLGSSSTSGGNFAADCFKHPDTIHVFRISSNGGTSRSRAEFTYLAPSSAENINIRFSTGHINFGRRVFVERITIVHAGWSTRAIPLTLTLTAVLDGGVEQTITLSNTTNESTIGMLVSGQHVYYYPNITCQALKITFGGASGMLLDGPFPSSANSAGNLDMTDLRNLPHRYRAELSAGFNAAVSGTAVSIVLDVDDPLSDAGNIKLVLIGTWTMDMGYEDIIIDYVHEDVVQ